MLNKLCLSILFLCLIIACGNSNGSDAQNKKPQQDNEVLKDSLQDLPLIDQLSLEDQMKLAKAKGKTARPITIEELLSYIEEEDSKLKIFSFWKLDDKLSQSQNYNLLKVQRELGEEKMKVHAICLDEVNRELLVNVYLRHFGFQDDAFILQDSFPYRWPSQFVSEWQGDLPALLFVHKTTGTRLFYQQLLSFEELMAILQSLIL